VSVSPDKLTNKAVLDDLAETGRYQAALVSELVIRYQGKGDRSLKLDRYMNEGSKNARDRIFYEVLNIERPVTAMELHKKMKIPLRTVHHITRVLTDEGWLEEIVGPAYSRWQLA